MLLLAALGSLLYGVCGIVLSAYGHMYNVHNILVK